MKKLGRVFFAILLVVGMVFLLTEHMGIQAYASDDKVQGTMSFTGKAEINVKPDVAYIYLGVETQDEVALEAQKRNAEIMTKVFQGLKEAGLKKENIETSDFSVEPVREYMEDTKKWVTVGYRAINRVKVTVTDLDRVGELIDVSIKSGANTVQNVVFSVKDESQWKLMALEAALKDAQAKAKTAASVLDVKITGIRSVDEGNGINLYPYATRGAFDGVLMEKASYETPIEAKDVKVSATVGICFNIE